MKPDQTLDRSRGPDMIRQLVQFSRKGLYYVLQSIISWCYEFGMQAQCVFYAKWRNLGHLWKKFSNKIHNCGVFLCFSNWTTNYQADIQCHTVCGKHFINDYSVLFASTYNDCDRVETFLTLQVCLLLGPTWIWGPIYFW